MTHYQAVAEEKPQLFPICGCKGARKAFEARMVLKERDLLAQKREQDTAYRIANCGVGKRYLDAQPQGHFKDYVMLLTLMLEQGTGIFVQGKKGTGKTYAASSVVLVAVREQYTAELISSAQLFELLKSSFGSRDMTDSILARYQKLDLLVIDDLGKEHVTDWSISQLFALIDWRYSNRRSTIVTTQYTGAQLVEIWRRNGDINNGVAMLSRLNQCCDRVDMGGIDKRLGGEEICEKNESLSLSLA